MHMVPNLFLLLVLLSLRTATAQSELLRRLAAADSDDINSADAANEVATTEEEGVAADCEDVRSPGESTEEVDQECVEVQEQECGACHSIYLRECSIRMEYSFRPEKVEECVEYPPPGGGSDAVAGDCVQGYRRICRTAYRSECGTRMQYRDMEEDHPVCGIQMTEDCSKKAVAAADKKGGGGGCRKVPVMRCRIEKRTVRKGQPETACRRVPEEICKKEKCAVPAAAGGATPRRKCFERVRMSRELVPREECGYREKRVCQQTSQSECRIRKRKECTPRYFVSRRQCKRVHSRKEPPAAATAIPAVQQP